MLLDLPSGRMAVRDTGSGRAVVFLHGFPHRGELWAHATASLSQRVRCLVPDLRGFGDSDVAGPWTVDRYAEDVRELLDHLDIARAVLVGLSMGGYIALAAWRCFPERISALALLDTRAAADDAPQRDRRTALIAAAETHGVDAIVHAMLPGMLGKHTRQTRPHLVAEMDAMMRSAPIGGIVGALSAMRDRPDARATIGSITVPTLLVVGEDDVLTPPADAIGMADALPSDSWSRLEIIADAGHVSCFERPAAVTHVLADFLASLDAPAS